MEAQPMDPTHSSHELDHSLRPWQPGLRRRAPWVGMASLILGLLCILFTALILYSAHESPVDSWPSESRVVQPAVLLAFISTATNVLLNFAMSEGCIIAWWSKALEGGDVNDLHRYWSYGTSLGAAALSGRSFNKVALACLLTSSLAVNGPLLQRASTVATKQYTTVIPVSANLSTSPLPAGFSGIYMTQENKISMLTPAFANISRDYASRAPIMTRNTGCSGGCLSSFHAAGFDMNCSSMVSHHYNLTSPEPGAKTMLGYAAVKFDGSLNSGQINLETLYKKTSACAGQLILHRCRLQTAIVRYKLRITAGGSDKLTLTPLNMRKPGNNTIRLYQPPPEHPGSGAWPSTIGGIAMAAQHIYASNITSIYNSSLAIVATGMMANTYINSDLNEYSTCNVSWTDPMQDIINTIRELTFRAALAASDHGDNQRHNATETIDRTYYVSSYRYLIAAMVLTFVSACVIVPLFAGWWHLGREVSLSPIETAKAFRAPLLHGTECNSNIQELLQEVGHRKAQYGAISSTSQASPSGSGFDTRTWGRAEIQLHEFLTKGYRGYGQNGSIKGVASAFEKGLGAQRLQIADPGLVRPPVDGVIYRDHQPMLTGGNPMIIQHNHSFSNYTSH
ncbi:hypothetical protein MMC30_002368 [Trapelia coarctata]|nr:hypothetical protein [Trapelia coarctata]